MFVTLLLSGLAIVALVAAVPPPPPPMCEADYTVYFDDLRSTEPPGYGLQNLNLMDTYNALHFQHFGIYTQDTFGVADQHSGTQGVAFGVENGQNLVYTGDYLDPVDESFSKPFLKKENTHRVATFEMREVWINCMSRDESGQYIPVSCMILATGIRDVGNKRVYDMIRTKPDKPDLPPHSKSPRNEPKLQQQRHVFNAEMKGLEKVFFEVIGRKTENDTIVTMDDLSYTTHFACLYIPPCRNYGRPCTSTPPSPAKTSTKPPSPKKTSTI